MTRGWNTRARARSPWFRVFSCRALALMALGLLAASALRAEALDLPFLHAGVHLSTAKRAYWRYEMVEFQVDAPGGVLNPASDPVLEVRIFKDGHPAAGLAGREACLLRWDGNLQAWRGRWPIPWNPVLGDYEARLAQPAAEGEGTEHVYFAGPGLTRTVKVLENRWLASCGFTLRGRKPQMLPAGFSVITLEPGHNGYRVPAPDGGKRGPLNAFAWARFMEADAFWHCALETEAWDGQGPEDQPWQQEDLENMELLASQAAQQGVAYGAYMLTFLVEGDFKSTDYEFTLSFDRASGTLQPIRFISMADTKRQREIIAALKRLGSTPGVSYIGLDYLRANTGGLEFTDEFLSDFDLDVPAELRRAGVEQRRLWLGRHLAYDQDKRLYELWDWWRAHRVSLVLKSILEEAKVTQPVWVFSLGWKQGHQHGQDPRMLIDAGISFNAPMFYEATGDQFPVMMSDWQHYLAKTGGVLVLGQCVDSKLLHPRPGFNGPEEYLERHMEALDALKPYTDRIAFFWHDLNRAMAGGRGQEGTREWALAGAASFSRLRESDGVVPMSLSISAAPDIEAGMAPGASFPARLGGTVRVGNLSAARLDKVRVEGVWTPGLGDFEPNGWWLRDLKPGEYRDLTYTVNLTERQVRAAYAQNGYQERMLAFKAKVWKDGAWPRPAMNFIYWKSGTPAPPDAAAPGKDAAGALKPLTRLRLAPASAQAAVP